MPKKKATSHRRSRRKASPRQLRLPLKRSITLKVDSEALTKAEKVLAERGTDIKNWMALQIGALSMTAKPVVGLVDPMPFGKYIGARVEDVVRGDPSYANWMLSKDGPSDRFHDEVRELFEELQK